MKPRGAGRRDVGRVARVTVLDELDWRGFLAETTDRDALSEHLASPIRFYIGFDPTAPSLHMGNLVQLMLARRLQAAGHHPYLLVGGSTGRRRPLQSISITQSLRSDLWASPRTSSTSARTGRPAGPLHHPDRSFAKP